MTVKAPSLSIRLGRPGVEFPEAFAAFLRLLRSSPEPRVTVRGLRAELGTGSHGKISEHLANCWARVASMLESGTPDALRRVPAPIADEFERLYRLIEDAGRQDRSTPTGDALLQSECVELRAQRTALQAELAGLRSERAAEQKRLQSAKEHAAGLDKQNHELTVRVTELHQRLSDRERHLQMLGEQNDALTRLLSRAQTERESLERRAAQLEQDLSELRRRFESNLARLLVRARPTQVRPTARKARPFKGKANGPRKAKTRATRANPPSSKPPKRRRSLR